MPFAQFKQNKVTIARHEPLQKRGMRSWEKCSSTSLFLPRIKRSQSPPYLYFLPFKCTSHSLVFVSDVCSNVRVFHQRAARFCGGCRGELVFVRRPELDTLGRGAAGRQTGLFPPPLNLSLVVLLPVYGDGAPLYDLLHPLFGHSFSELALFAACRACHLLFLPRSPPLPPADVLPLRRGGGCFPPSTVPVRVSPMSQAEAAPMSAQARECFLPFPDI